MSVASKFARYTSMPGKPAGQAWGRAATAFSKDWMQDFISSAPGPWLRGCNVEADVLLPPVPAARCLDADRCLAPGQDLDFARGDCDEASQPCAGTLPAEQGPQYDQWLGAIYSSN